MEGKLELLYMGAAAICFAVFVMGWLMQNRQVNQGLIQLEQRMNQELHCEYSGKR